MQFQRLQQVVRSSLGDATREALGEIIAALRVRAAQSIALGHCPAPWLKQTAGLLLVDVSGRIQIAQQSYDRLLAEHLHAGEAAKSLVEPALSELAGQMAARVYWVNPQAYQLYARRVHRISPSAWSEDTMNPLGATVFVRAYLSCIGDSLAMLEPRALIESVLLGENANSIFRVVSRGHEVMMDSGISPSAAAIDFRYKTNPDLLFKANPTPVFADLPDIIINSPFDESSKATPGGKNGDDSLPTQSAIPVPLNPSSPSENNLDGALSTQAESQDTPSAFDSAGLSARVIADAQAGQALNPAVRSLSNGATSLVDQSIIRSIEALEADAVAFAHAIDQSPYSRASRQRFFADALARLNKEGGSPSQLSIVEIVAAMFDYAIDDRRLPETARPLVWRLQIPALTLALIDPAYLGERPRSLRRLLDNVGAITSIFGQELTRGSEVYRRLETLVRAVEIVSNGLSVRTQALAVQVEREFQRCATGMTQLNDRVSRDRIALETAPGRQNRRDFSRRPGRDEERLATEKLTGLIASKVKGQVLPASVDAFLQSVWMRYMRTALLREGEKSVQFTRAEQLVDDLLWTLDQDAGVVDRRQLARRIPGLIDQVTHGLHEVGAQEEDHQAFFDELFLIHLRKLRRLRGETGAAGSEPASQEGQEGNSQLRSVVPASSALSGFEEPVPVLDDRLDDAGSWGQETDGLESGFHDSLATGLADPRPGPTVPVTLALGRADTDLLPFEQAASTVGPPNVQLGPVSESPARLASNDDDVSAVTAPIGGNRLLTELQAIDLGDLPGAPTFQSRAEAAELGALVQGSWVEYRHLAGQPVYLKIAWLNERRSVALLVRHPDRRAMSKPMKHLRALIASGRLRLLRIECAA